jgi:PemK-like, MazF-like toxin of type II toxin-antitoxin system
MSAKREAGSLNGPSWRRPRSRSQFRADRAAVHALYRHAMRRERLLRSCRILPRSAFASGSVFSAQVNYREGIGAKVRPVVVIHASSFDVLVVPCTTKRTSDALRLIDPSAAGLRRETWLRPRPVKLVRNAFIERLGRVTVEDFNRALSAVRLNYLLINHHLASVSSHLPARP